MKKCIVLIFVVIIMHPIDAMQSRMKIGSYTGRSGEIIVAPRIQNIGITPQEAQQMHALQMLEREKALVDWYRADDRNSIMRGWANKRAMRRIYGSDSLYYNNSKEIKSSPMVPY